MRAVVIGASGATGKEVVKQLILDERFHEIIVLVRKSLSLSSQKIMEIIVDFDQLPNWKDEIKGDVAFSCLGTTLKAAGSKEAQYKVDYDYQYQFAQLASENQIPTFLLISSTGADVNSFLFYSKMKGALEQSIEKLSFNSTIFFRPGPLVRPNTDRVGEKWSVIVISALNKIGLLKNMTPLPVQDLAKLMIHYAIHPIKGKIILESERIVKEVAKSK